MKIMLKALCQFFGVPLTFIGLMLFACGCILQIGPKKAHRMFEAFRNVAKGIE